MKVSRNYKKELTKLDKLPKERISQIYIIPSKMYNGFWGKNGYRSFDFIVGDKEIYGWFHWEGDVINIVNKKDYGMSIDSEENMYIRLYNGSGFIIKGLDISTLTISSIIEESDENDNKIEDINLYKFICKHDLVKAREKFNELYKMGECLTNGEFWSLKYITKFIDLLIEEVK